MEYEIAKKVFIFNSVLLIIGGASIAVLMFIYNSFDVIAIFFVVFFLILAIIQLYYSFRKDETKTFTNEVIPDVVKNANIIEKNKKTAIKRDKVRLKIKNIPVTISFIIGAIYTIYLVIYIISVNGSGNSGAENLGIAIGSVLIMPHAICVLIATIFNGLGLLMNKRGFVLAEAILYAVSMALMFIYFMFVIIEMVLSFVGYAKMKRIGGATS